jgi:uroporphyrinogen-III synthase
VVRPAAPPYDAAALMRVAPFAQPAGLNVLVARGEKGRDDWIEQLRAAGARVEVRAIYRAEQRAPSPDALAALDAWAREPAPVVFVFSGADGIAAADELLAARGLHAWACAQPALAVHPRQADALAARGWRRARTIEPGERSLVVAIESA